MLFPYRPGSEGITCPECRTEVLKPPINGTTRCECGLCEIVHRGTQRSGTCDLFMYLPEEGRRWKLNYWEGTEADMLEYERKEKDRATAKQAEADANSKALRDWAAWQYLDRLNNNSKQQRW